MSEPFRIIVGDVLDGLRQLPDGCVHTCVTSPPYWGLRDYGTASWEGGDATCDHKSPPRGSTMICGSAAKKTGPNQTEPFGAQYRGTCGKCGARRIDQQIGLEATPDEFVSKMVEVFREVRRVLREDGTLWLNLGDSYASGTIGRDDTGRNSGGGEFNGGPNWQRSRPDGMKPKDLCMMPWRVSMALQADGWWIRSVICWAKKSPMPESCRDRPTSSWEPIFLLTKAASYWYDNEAVKETSEQPERIGKVEKTFSTSDAETTGRGDVGREVLRTATRNLRNVWHLGPEPYAEAHFATFPTEIPRRCIKAGTSEKGCCPACGAGWVRQIERVGGPPAGDHRKRDDFRQTAYNENAHPDGVLTGGSLSAIYAKYGMPRSVTLGWEPGCSCNAGEPVPALVLDPFLGSGTTVAVARELGRHGVGIELNPEYAALARERIGRAERPATYRSDRTDDAPLFGSQP